MLVLALVGLAAALVVVNRQYRTGEMALASVFVSWTSDHGVYLAADRQALYFGLGGDRPFGLAMSPECTSAFLVLPLVLVAAVMIALRPRISSRVLLALGVAAVAVVVVNQLRILTLVGLVGWLGTDRGYYWGHTLLGSMVSVLGGAAALVLFVRLATRKPREAG
ncbi:exosortase/archaeosortase family protein [Actinokineospora bangkokensis]|uniref:Exosortase/archaeosortase family protein n=1 Tax=Actinokineospora bangkokensis TaxID=1193682 RepID=A0A1Q9LC48_9PSEU|nr:exosortase/archaeosortase family protein [Actinokineospora bangkokensis]